MGRERVVSRTITKKTVKVWMLNKETGKAEKSEFVVPLEIKTDEKIIAYLNKNVPLEENTVVSAIYDTVYTEHKYAMSEVDFIHNANVVNKKEVESEEN